MLLEARESHAQAARVPGRTEPSHAAQALARTAPAVGPSAPPAGEQPPPTRLAGAGAGADLQGRGGTVTGTMSS